LEESVPHENRMTGAEAVGLLKLVAREGFVFAVTKSGPAGFCSVLVLRHLDRPETRRLLAAAAPAGDRDGGPGNAPPPSNQKLGRVFHAFGESGVWWVENGDLILTQKAEVEEIAAVIDGKEPSAIDHLLRMALARTDGDLRQAGLGFLDMAAWP